MRLARGLTLALALLGPASAAHAATVGLADQQAAAYADPRAQALGLRYARLTVPWDAATSQPQAVATWLAAVRAAGMAPHVAFEHLATDRCPQRPCTTPTAAQYGAAVRRFVARFPQVRTYTTWNEANHASQPVADDPEAVAAYYDELRAACASCTVVAGDVLDSGSYRRWLAPERFLRASATTPRLWGLHDYGDVTYGRTTGVDTVLATVPGALWIEETGGLVALRNATGSRRLHRHRGLGGERDRRAFAIAAANPRIGRMYVYQWRANATDRFDAGLVRPDGSARPSYAALARDLAAPARAALEGDVVDAARRAPGAARHVHDERPRLPRPGDRLHRRPPRRRPRVPHLGAPPDRGAARRRAARAPRGPPRRAPGARRRARASPHRRWTSPSPHPQPGGNA